MWCHSPTPFIQFVWLLILIKSAAFKETNLTSSSNSHSPACALMQLWHPLERKSNLFSWKCWAAQPSWCSLTQPLAGAGTVLLRAAYLHGVHSASIHCVEEDGDRWEKEEEWGKLNEIDTQKPHFYLFIYFAFYLMKQTVVSIVLLWICVHLLQHVCSSSWCLFSCWHAQHNRNSPSAAPSSKDK